MADWGEIDWCSADSLALAGFQGFLPIGELMLDDRQIPDVRGVYVLVRPDRKAPVFLEVGTGGHFKGKNPNVEADLLQAHWVDQACAVYIGKAGDPGISATLRKRLRQYLRFGCGKNIGHWGGRYVWQLAGAPQLLICWLPLPDGHPSAVETLLIAQFRNQFGKRPFANLAK